MLTQSKSAGNGRWNREQKLWQLMVSLEQPFGVPGGLGNRKIFIGMVIDLFPCKAYINCKRDRAHGQVTKNH